MAACTYFLRAGVRIKLFGSKAGSMLPIARPMLHIARSVLTIAMAMLHIARSMLHRARSMLLGTRVGLPGMHNAYMQGCGDECR